MKKQSYSRRTPDHILHVGKPNIGDRKAFISRISQALDTKRLTNNGPFVHELESQISKKLRVKHCVAVNSGTTALEIAIQTLGMTGEVILPSFTFISTAHALQRQGITPVFCDIDPETHNLDPKKVEVLITERTSGIIGVHLWGRPCAPEALTQIAKKHGLALLFDAAHAFGCSHKNKMLGTFGNAETLSFHATKFINSAEGGAIVTQNDEIADKARQIRNLGFIEYDKVISHGVNGKMNELCAALGLTNLESMDNFIAVNYQNYEQYKNELSDIPGLSLSKYNSQEKNNWQYIVIIIDKTIIKVTRDDLVSMLHRHGILARRYFWPGCHKMEPYRSNNPRTFNQLPATESIAENILILPTGTGVSPPDITYICQLLNKTLANN